MPESSLKQVRKETFPNHVYLQQFCLFVCFPHLKCNPQNEPATQQVQRQAILKYNIRNDLRSKIDNSARLNHTSLETNKLMKRRVARGSDNVCEMFQNTFVSQTVLSAEFVH